MKHKDESAMEYLRRLVGNLNYESETLLNQLTSVDALCDFFDLWAVYDTDLWEGVLESIAEGDDPKPAFSFISKYKLGKFWLDDVEEAILRRKNE